MAHRAERIVDFERFAAAIDQLYQDDENLSVYLRADRNVKYKHVKEVMEACSNVGIVDIIFGTFESGN